MEASQQMEARSRACIMQIYAPDEMMNTSELMVPSKSSSRDLDIVRARLGRDACHSYKIITSGTSQPLAYFDLHSLP